MKQYDDEKTCDRRGFLQCMAWVGTGAMWTLSSGVLKGMPPRRDEPEDKRPLGPAVGVPLTHAPDPEPA